VAECIRIIIYRSSSASSGTHSNRIFWLCGLLILIVRRSVPGVQDQGSLLLSPKSPRWPVKLKANTPLSCQPTLLIKIGYNTIRYPDTILLFIIQ
jgi:hypothetical protein